ncbi:hypothetical protein VUR80DRAFT_3476 [Thermomyces stellatus]
MPKVVILAGAPEASALDWSLALHDSFTHPLSSLLNPVPLPAPPPASASVDASGPAWRSVPLEWRPLKTGFTQQTPSSDAAFPSFLHPQFSQTSSISFEEDGDAEDELSQFYEYSIATYNSQPPSQPTGVDNAADSFASDYSVAPSLEPGIGPGPTDLSELRPPPGRPEFSRPVTLLVGIISLAAKTVRTRFGERDLVELLVGDDTRSAFQLTLWLGPPGITSELSRSVSTLRVGDVVLVQGVAVGTFRGRVYGQSMRGGMGTRVFLLFRERHNGEETRGHYSWADIIARGEVHPQLGKTRRVRKWMRGVDMASREGRGREEDCMPDDTLE